MTRLHFTCQLTLSCFSGRLWLCWLGLNTFLRSVEGIQQSQNVICGYCLRLNSKNWYQPPPSELWGSGCATSRHRTLHHTPSSRTAGLWGVEQILKNAEELVDQLSRQWKMRGGAFTNLFCPAQLCTSLKEADKHLPHRASFAPEHSWQTHTTVVTFNVSVYTIWLHANITWSNIER